MQERNSYSAQEWKKLTAEEKSKFKERVVEQNNLTDKEREKVM